MGIQVTILLTFLHTSLSDEFCHFSLVKLLLTSVFKNSVQVKLYQASFIHHTREAK